MNTGKQKIIKICSCVMKWLNCFRITLKSLFGEFRAHNYKWLNIICWSWTRSEQQLVRGSPCWVIIPSLHCSPAPTIWAFNEPRPALLVPTNCRAPTQFLVSQTPAWVSSFTDEPKHVSCSEIKWSSAWHGSKVSSIRVDTGLLFF